MVDNWIRPPLSRTLQNELVSDRVHKIEVVFCSNDDAWALLQLYSSRLTVLSARTSIWLVDALAEAVPDGNMTGTVLNDDVGQAARHARRTCEAVGSRAPG